MIVKINGPVHDIDRFVYPLFVQIFNVLTVAADPIDLNRMLSGLEQKNRIKPSDYFDWGIDRFQFQLRQRIDRRSIGLFDDIILSVLFYDQVLGRAC